LAAIAEDVKELTRNRSSPLFTIWRIRDELSHMDELFPGYYGPGGFHQIYWASLKAKIMNPREHFAVMSYILNKFVQDDLSVTKEEASKIRAASRRFGELVHPDRKLTKDEDEAVKLFCEIVRSTTKAKVHITTVKDLVENEDDNENDNQNDSPNTDEIDSQCTDENDSQNTDENDSKNTDENDSQNTDENDSDNTDENESDNTYDINEDGEMIRSASKGKVLTPTVNVGNEIGERLRKRCKLNEAGDAGEVTKINNTNNNKSKLYMGKLHGSSGWFCAKPADPKFCGPKPNTTSDIDPLEFYGYKKP